MSTTSVTIPKDSSASVTFRLSEPIVCKQQKGAECAVVIRVDNPAADRIALSPCVVKWTNADWHQPRVLKGFCPGVLLFICSSIVCSECSGELHERCCS